jgi:hypothetical protein
MNDGRIGYIKKDRQERFNRKRGWFVNAWRIVDVAGNDLTQSWLSTKGEALMLAKQMNIQILGVRE